MKLPILPPTKRAKQLMAKPWFKRLPVEGRDEVLALVRTVEGLRGAIKVHSEINRATPTRILVSKDHLGVYNPYPLEDALLDIEAEFVRDTACIFIYPNPGKEGTDFVEINLTQPYTGKSTVSVRLNGTTTVSISTERQAVVKPSSSNMCEISSVPFA